MSMTVGKKTLHLFFGGSILLFFLVLCNEAEQFIEAYAYLRF